MCKSWSSALLAFKKPSMTDIVIAFTGLKTLVLKSFFFFLLLCQRPWFALYIFNPNESCVMRGTLNPPFSSTEQSVSVYHTPSLHV